MKLLFCTLAFLLVTGIDGGKKSLSRFYECDQSRHCQASDSVEPYLGPGQHPSLQACRIVCHRDAGLWPVPTGRSTYGANYLSIDPSSFQFVNVNDLAESARSFILDAINIFMNNIRALCEADCKPTDRKVVVNLKIESSSLDLGWNTNEGYHLTILPSGAPDQPHTQLAITLTAQTVYGARHGLETLSQLVAPGFAVNGTSELVILDAATVRDKPVFSHRGLLIDTSRNFLDVKDILRTIDGLAATKMNVLHWHATDSQSFPLEIRSVPLMAVYGAYGPDKIYSSEDMQMITRYAKSRGVRIILEIDSPAHAGAGWQWGESENLGNLTVCVNQQPWNDFCYQPPCGQLNPVNPNVYAVLRSIYKELLKTFGRNGMMHLGGDELCINCWNSTNEVTSAMKIRGLGHSTEDFLQIWSEMHNKQVQILNEESEDRSTDKAIVWSSQLTSPEFIERYLNKDKFIVQTWVSDTDLLNQKLLRLGYKLIISTENAWYLDHGFWGGTKYQNWRAAYKNIIPQEPGVLGGEACMWGEYVFGGSLDSRVWPRTAAVAERLWSDPSTAKTVEAELRLHGLINRLQRRKIFPDAITPEWCSQHEGQCW